MSARSLRILLIALTLVGLGVASYLTYVHYSGIKVACTAGESCTKVQTSQYSKLAGIPVALIGLIGYVGILLSLLAPEREETRFATVSLTVIGFGFSAYLTYREVFTIDAICQWCVVSAVLMTLLAILGVWRLLRVDASNGGPATIAEPARLPRDTTGVGA
jgi:uncharacterized membrane protein